MTLGLKYKLVTLIFGGTRHHLISYTCTSVPDAYSQCTHQFLTPMLSARISSLRAWSAFFKGPFQLWKFYAYTEHTRKKLMCMLRIRISSWRVCTANASVPDPEHYAPGRHQFLMHMLSMFLRDALVPDVYAQCTHQFLTWYAQADLVCSGNALVPNVYAQCTHQFLISMLSARITDSFVSD